MKTKRSYIAPLLAAGATAVAIAVAPIAVAPTAAAASGQGAASGSGAAAGPSDAAAPSDSSQSAQSCVSLGGTQNQCQSPGNVQIYDAPPQVDYFPYAGGAT
jgi:hypothetical protein